VLAIPLSRFALFAIIAIGGCALDLWSKGWMFTRLGNPGGPTWWIWPEYFGFQTSLNQGALFGFGQGKVWLFAGLSILAAVAIVFWLFVVGAARDRLLTIALGGVLAGVLGNLYDRLGLWWTPAAEGYPQHAVRDWILFQYGNWVWPNFNVADMLLVGGAGLLILHTWVTPELAPSTVPNRT
jgi:signal peptidase II